MDYQKENGDWIGAVVNVSLRSDQISDKIIG